MSKKILTVLLLISAMLMIFGIGTVSAASSYTSAGGNIVEDYLKTLGGDKYTSCPYDWMRFYLGDITVNNMCQNYNEAINVGRQ